MLYKVKVVVTGLVAKLASICMHMCTVSYGVCVCFASGVSGFCKWGRRMAYLRDTELCLSHLPPPTDPGSSSAQLPHVCARDQYTQPESSGTRSDKFAWSLCILHHCRTNTHPTAPALQLARLPCFGKPHLHFQDWGARDTPASPPCP